MSDLSDRDAEIEQLDSALAAQRPGSAGHARACLQLAARLLQRSMSTVARPGDGERADGLLTGIHANAAAEDDVREAAAMMDPVRGLLAVLPVELRWDGSGPPTTAHLLPVLSRWAADPETSGLDAPRLLEALGRFDAFAARPGLPEGLRSLMRAMGGMQSLLRQLERDDADGSVTPDVLEELAAASADLADPTLQQLLAGMTAWLVSDQDDPTDPQIAAARAADLERVLSRLPADHAMRPLLERNLARLKALAAERSGEESTLREALALFESALGGMGDAGHPMYADTRHQVAGARLVLAAMTGEPALQDAAERLAAEIGAVPPGTEHDEGRTALLDGMVRLLRARNSGTVADLGLAMTALLGALERLEPGHILHRVALSLLAALLHDRQLVAGALADREAAGALFRIAAEVSDLPDVGGAVDSAAGALLRGMAAVGTIAAAQDRDDPAGLAAALADLEDALRAVPDPHLLRHRLQLVLGVGRLSMGMRTGDPAAISAGFEALDALELPTVPDRSGRSVVRVARLATSLLRDPAATSVWLEQLGEDAGDLRLPPDQRAATLAIVGLAHLARHATAAAESSDDVWTAVAHLRQAAEALATLPYHPQRHSILFSLAGAHRLLDPADPIGRRAAQEGLAAVGAEVLLQSGADDALVVVRDAARQALDLAHWALAFDEIEAAMQALETGRALVLHAATTVLDVPDQLVRAGRPDLAEEWRRDLSNRGQQGLSCVLAEGGQFDGASWRRFASDVLHPGTEVLPSDVRHRALTVLRDSPAGVRLLTPPGVNDVRPVLREAGADALVYLVPGVGDTPGRVLVLTEDGEPAVRTAAELRLDHPALQEFLTVRERVSLAQDLGDSLDEDDSGCTDEGVDSGVPEDWRRALERVCDWAWDAAIEPLTEVLPPPAQGEVPHVVVIPVGPLGGVPWHAACRTEGNGEIRVACRQLLLSYAASARQLADVVRRVPLPVDLRPVIVGDPLGDLFGSALEASALRDVLYPHAVLLGPAESVRISPLYGEDVDLATPAAVLGWLPGSAAVGASLVHLSCHAELGKSPLTSHLRLVPDPEDPIDEGKLLLSRVLERSQCRAVSAPGSMIVLSSCISDLTSGMEDEALTLATAFLAAGATGVVGSRWPVSDRLTPLVMFAFHHFLHRGEYSAAEALRQAQLWMLSPDRIDLDGMPDLLLGDSDTYDLTHPYAWAAFGLHGR